MSQLEELIERFETLETRIDVYGKVIESLNSGASADALRIKVLEGKVTNLIADMEENARGTR